LGVWGHELAWLGAVLVALVLVLVLVIVLNGLCPWSLPIRR
jgi:hypothetical protein